MNELKKIILFQANLMLAITNAGTAGLWDKVTNFAKNSFSKVSYKISETWNSANKNQKLATAMVISAAVIYSAYAKFGNQTREFLCERSRLQAHEELLMLHNAVIKQQEERGKQIIEERISELTDEFLKNYKQILLSDFNRILEVGYNIRKS